MAWHIFASSSKIASIPASLLGFYTCLVRHIFVHQDYVGSRLINYCFIGTEGPRTSNPARYIRYIYNRVILENATVRAAAVSALARFGALCDDLLPNILVLLARYVTSLQ